MTKNRSLRGALAAALLSTTLASCNFVSKSSEQSGGHPVAEASGMTLDQKAEKQIRDAIAQAPMHGLKPDLFLKGNVTGEALLQAGLKYASALATGYSDPKKLFEVYTISRASSDVRAGMQQAIQKGNVGEWLSSLAPQTPEYKALSQAFVRYAKLAGQGTAQQIASDTAIKPGQSDERVTKIAAVLRAGGYLPDDQQQTAADQKNGQQSSQTNALQHGAANNTYLPEMVLAVKQFQADSGVKSDGVLGKDTLTALNTGAASRARQLAVAMERLRWLQREPAKTRIDVNTAASFLDYYRDGQHVDHRKVINGEPDKPTPQLQAPIYRLVAKPTWTVPKGIAEKELTDKGNAWLKNNDFVMKDGYYVQQSGPKSALGLVKFDMQDDEAIYLHDTPAKSVFAQDDRHRSHGCVRVENAVQFATALAQQEGVLDPFKQAMQKNDQSFVKLPNEIPVRLLYQTAFWDGSRIQFRRDLYGWDENVAKALDLAPGEPQKIDQPESSDIGP
ncbi:murein L,D-transpeptidase [Sphingomonas oligophenolica]|uniref:Murein L,D-transpeptidase n=2 Tax=Sphingomonas oligophenolica TaxID=301154 RepID=A0A502C6C1_9SPHN|nr:murein L,D-transpeptidase [Sphingomonas oligophenolica]